MVLLDTISGFSKILKFFGSSAAASCLVILPCLRAKDMCASDVVLPSAESLAAADFFKEAVVGLGFFAIMVPNRIGLPIVRQTLHLNSVSHDWPFVPV